MEASPKKGTTTVGLVCKDGIVLAADKRATAGTRIAKGTRIDKVVQVADYMAMTTAGLVSDIQLFTKIIKSQLMLLKMRKTKEPGVKEAASLLGNLAYSNIRRPSMIPGIVGFLFAGSDKTGCSLYEVAFDGTVLKVDTFASDGSGSSIALGVLETLYRPNMTTVEATEIAIRALQSAIERDSATGNGLDVAVINEKGVKFVEHKTVKLSYK
tara:strand:- start:1647 stop:2282 length:636 start_codon:yes stop_codon:yes gene_type:complete